MLIERLLYAQDTGGGGGVGVIPAETQEEQAEQQEQEEYQYVVEGSEEAEQSQQQDIPEDLRDKSREEILAQIVEERKKLASAQTGSEPVAALTETMREMLGKVTPEKKPVTYGYAVAPEIPTSPELKLPDKEFSDTIATMMIDNPVRAQQLVIERQLSPLLSTVASSQLQLSRELALSKENTKKVYDKYAQEVEEIVASIPVASRLQNPNLYKQAIDLVQSRHVDELVSDQLEARVQEAVEKRLASLGIKTNGNAAQLQTSYTAPSTAQRPSSSAVRKTVVIPKWVAEQADRKGLDPSFYYAHLKSKGEIK